MKRTFAVVALTATVPMLAWGVASAGGHVPMTTPAAAASGAAPPPTTTTTVPPTAAASAPETSAAAAPAPTTTAPPSAPPTTAPSTTAAPPTTVATSAPTTVATTRPTTTVAPTGPTTTTTTAPPTTGTGPTTTVATTVPAPSTTAAPTTTAVEPSTTTTDPLSEPTTPPTEVPGGRVVIPRGSADTGEVRAVTFPVAGPASYVNDFGACRDGCARSHKGNDIIGNRLQPILAMQTGTIDHLVDHPTAGYGVVIRDAEGWTYHVYHMNNDTPGTDDGADAGPWRFTPGIVEGARVTAGQVIGWMGDSGNSEGSVPHAHVEIQRPDGTAINPYWSLRMAQRDVNCGVVTLPAPTDAELAATTTSPTTTTVAGAPLPVLAAGDEGWLASGWLDAELPGEWMPLELQGGPQSGPTVARMYIGPAGFMPVDAAALRVGDGRYDDGVDCADPASLEVTSNIPAEIAAILATIRHLESGGNYTAQAAKATASGAYQFVDGTWNNYGGYPKARLAPPAVQDAKAAEYVTSILAANGGDVAVIPVVWYIGRVPVGAEWDTVPMPEAGNRLTPREYQRRWLGVYAQKTGAAPLPGQPTFGWQPVDVDVVCRTAVVNVGEPGTPEYVLTQASEFAAAPDGLAVIAPPTTTTTTSTTTTTLPGATTTTVDPAAPTTTTTTAPPPVDPCDPARPAPDAPEEPAPVTVAVNVTPTEATLPKAPQLTTGTPG